MIYGEHLSADEQTVKCPCGETATVEVVDPRGCSCGWLCRKHAADKRAELKRQTKIATAIVKKGRP